MTAVNVINTKNMNLIDTKKELCEWQRGMAKWGSTWWIINQLESEVGALVEQGVIDLAHGPKVPGQTVT